MSSQAPLASIIAYLRFPLRAEHRGGLCAGVQCPHCQRSRIQKWGGFAGRQRFRCRDCRRTFSTFTNTPLRWLKHPERRWRAFLWCMEGRLTVRRTGEAVGIDKNTALRWRHRVLDQWREEPLRRLRGSVAVGEFWLPLNEKGSRHLRRQPRRHGHAQGRWRENADRFYLVAAVEVDSDGQPDRWIGCTGVRDLTLSQFSVLLDPRLGPVRELIGGRGPLCALAQYAASIGANYSRQERGGAASGGAVRGELKRWLRPFRGVASRRLANYVAWFRLETGAGGWQTQMTKRMPAEPTIPADSAIASRREAGPPGPRAQPRAVFLSAARRSSEDCYAGSLVGRASAALEAPP